jgi:hypothetical protein
MSLSVPGRAVGRLGTRAAQIFREAAAIDLRSLALFRVCLGVVVLYDFLARLPDLRAHYSDDGVLPRRALGEVAWHLRLYLLSGELRWVGGLFAISILASVALVLGWRTRLATFVCWFSLLSLHTRNGLVLQGGDALIVLLLLWSLFLPLGAHWSVEAWQTRAQKAPLSPRIFGAATVALYLQVAVMYFITGTLKLAMPHWRRGEGVTLALSTDEFVTGFGLLLLPHQGLLVMMSHFTLALEILGPFLLLVPASRTRFRTALVFSFIAFHVGLALTMRLGLFSFVCMTAWIFALPSGFWIGLEARMRRLAGRRFPPADAGGGPLTSALGRVPGSWSDWLAGVLATYMVLATIVADRWASTRFGDVFLRPSARLGIKVRWSMFVGERSTTGHFVAAAMLEDGRQIDALRAGAPLRWERPAVPSATFPNQRWRKYMGKLIPEDADEARAAFADYLCREGRRGRWGSPVATLQVVYFKRKLRARDDGGAAEKAALIERRCSE